MRAPCCTRMIPPSMHNHWHVYLQPARPCERTPPHVYLHPRMRTSVARASLVRMKLLRAHVLCVFIPIMGACIPNNGCLHLLYLVIFKKKHQCSSPPEGYHPRSKMS